MEPCFKVIDFSDFQTAMLKMWSRANAPDEIRPIRKAFGTLRYSGEEALERILIFPVACYLNDRQVAWTLTTNISDTTIRFRGMYVEPEFRGHGIIHNMIDFSLALWPKPWTRCVGWFRENTTHIFLNNGWKLVPDASPRYFRQRDWQPSDFKSPMLFREFNL